MADEFPFEDPKDLWQNQPSESSKMSTEIIRRMARDIEEKAKFEALVGVGGGLFLTFVLGQQLLQANEVTQRIGWGILIFWGAYGAFQSRRLRRQPRRPLRHRGRTENGAV